MNQNCESQRCKYSVHETLKSLAKEQNLHLFSKEFAECMDDYTNKQLISELKKEGKGREEEFPKGWKSVRQLFRFPKSQPEAKEDKSFGEEVIYFVGNSLGLQLKRTSNDFAKYLDRWGDLGVVGHFHEDGSTIPFGDFGDQISPLSAHLLGAKEEELMIMGGLSMNIHFLLLSFYKPTPDRYKILIEDAAFPSDILIAQTQIEHHGYDRKKGVITVPRREDGLTYYEDIERILEEEGSSIALVFLPGVQYYTGQLFPIQKITELAQQKGCKVGFDLAHAAGNVPLSLHDWNVDFASWCSYKYLNCGPGSVGGIFVHSKETQNHQTKPELAGWFGLDHTTRFSFDANALMEKGFSPAPGAAAWRISNDPVFSMIPMIGSMELFNKVNISNLRFKSMLLTAYLELLLSEYLSAQIKIITPADPMSRGSQLSLEVLGDKSQEIRQELANYGVYFDFRQPSSIRIAPTALYNTFYDVYRFVVILSSLFSS